MKKLLMIIMIAFSVISLNAQQKGLATIKGIVSDSNTKEPLAGASIYVPGTKIGTYTDRDGKFSLELKDTDVKIVISYIGFLDKITDVGSDTYFDIRLTPDANVLNEMVVIGYASKKKENLTGAVSVVSVEDAEDRAVPSVEMLLQGKVAGLMTTQLSSQPGSSNFEMRLRGINSMDNNNSPLVIVDGVEADLNSINSKDIESMTVLKDASSAAIYGARAAAGVILITSKQGKRGMKISYSNSFSMQFPTRIADIVEDPVQYIDLANEAFINSGQKPKYNDAFRQKWLEGGTPETTPVDWKKLIFKNAFMHDHFVNMSGAGDRYDYAVSVGFKDQKGIVYSTSAQQFTYKTKVNVHFWDKKFTLGATINGRNMVSHEAQSSYSILDRYMQNRPILFLKSFKSETTLYGGGANFMAIEELGGGNDKDFNELNTAFTAKLTPVKGLSITANYSLIKRRTDLSKYIPKYEIAGSPEMPYGTVKRSQLTEQNTKYDRALFNVVASYSKSIKKHNFDLLAGFEQTETTNDSYSINGYDLSKNHPLISLLSPTTLTTDSSYYSYAIMSYFGRLSYDYAGRYLFEANFRRDGSSVFAPGYRYFNSPSVAVAWRIKKEPFMKRAKWVDDLKLRASYGILGNYYVSSNYYTFADKINPSDNYTFGGNLTGGYSYSSMANPYTTWEAIHQINIGLDFSFLKSFDLTVDVFQKRTSDMLSKIYQPLSLGVGANQSAVNAGAMLNRGFEITLGYKHYFNKDFKIYAEANLGYVKNTVVDLGGNESQWHNNTGTVRSEIGFPYMSLYGYKYIGLYQIEDFTWQNNSDPAIPHMEREYVLKPGVTGTTLHSSPRPGDLLLEDQDGDNVITTNDIVRLGNPRPEIQYSFTLGLNYKGFSFSVLAQGSGGNTLYLQRNPFYNTLFTGQLLSSFVTEHWTEDNPNYRCLFADKQRWNVRSSYDMHNGAYLRIKNVRMGYTFKGGFLEKIKVSSIRIFMSAENLLTISSFPKGFDPERGATSGSVAAYPLMRSVSAGLAVNF